MVKNQMKNTGGRYFLLTKSGRPGWADARAGQAYKIRFANARRSCKLPITNTIQPDTSLWKLY